MSKSGILNPFYPLSPLQEGLLFHTLEAPQSRLYFQQLSYVLQGELNVEAFKRAWEAVVERHPAMRAIFVWERRQKSLQVVLENIELPWQEANWRGVPPAEQQELLDEFLRKDQERGFELSKGPLIRFALFQLTEDTFQFVWTYHHILLDGWSISLIQNEVFAFYASFRRGQNLNLEAPLGYRNYIAWLQQQDLSAAEVYWRETLKGFKSPTPLGGRSASSEVTSDYDDYRFM